MRKLYALTFAICLSILCSTPAFADCTFGFLSETPLDAGNNSGDIATGDFNHDGLVDLAVVNRQSDKIAIMLGQQGGTFDDPTFVLTGGAFNNADIAAAYINDDEHLDLLVMGTKQVYNDVTFSEMEAQVLVGNGSGGFTIGDHEWIGYHPDRIAAGDFDNDGDTDFAIGRDTGNTAFHLIVNLPAGHIAGDIAQKSENQLEASVSGWFRAIAAADFDGDGKLDVALSDAINKKVWFFYGLADGTFTRGASAVVTTADPLHGAGPMVAADFNGDGYADIAVANVVTGSYEPGMATPNFLVALSNGGGRTFATPVVLGTVEGATDALARDMNADGKADVVLLLGSTARIFLGAGNGTFTSQDFGTGGIAVETLDIDKDGGLDLVTAGFTNGLIKVAQNTCGVPALSLTSSANPASYGNPFTVTGSLTSSPAATGTLTITRTGGGTVATTNLNASSTVSASQFQEIGTYEYVLTYSGDSRFRSSTKTLIQTVQQAPFGPPPGFQSTALGDGSVHLSWYPTSGTAKYEVFRRAHDEVNFQKIGETLNGNTIAFDDAPAAGKAYLYKVRAIAPTTNIASEYSSDFTISHLFTDETIVAGATTLKLAHLTEARAAANDLRALAGLGAATWTDSPIALAAQFNELRTAINDARSGLGASATTFTDTIAAGTILKRVHTLELRSAMR